MIRIFMSAIAGMLLLTAPAGAQQREPDPVYDYADEDARMNGAIEEALRHLPRYFAAFDAASEEARSDFMVKVAMDRSVGGLEHIWVDSLRREGRRLVGRLANEPQHLPGLHQGSAVTVDPKRISDWSITSPEGLYGAYTMRVIVEDLPAAEAQQYRAMLAATPLPAAWTQ